MTFLAFQPWYLLATLAGIGFVLVIISIIIYLRRKPVPATLILFIGLACILLFAMAAWLHPEKMPW